MAARVSPSSRPMSRWSATQVTARYMRPVSRNRNPNLRATSLPTVVLPDATGPSIAMDVRLVNGWSAGGAKHDYIRHPARPTGTADGSLSG